MNYRSITPKFSEKFFELVQKSKNIVITGHEAPDEDSISSILAIYALITTKFPKKNVRPLYSGEGESRFSIFKNFDKIKFINDIADHLKGADLLIMLDSSNFSRFSKKPEVLKLVPNSICIDHHASPIDSFTLSLVTPQYPACSEVVFRALFSKIKIDKPLAEIFLMGILGDTGNFAYLKPNQTKTLSLSQKLMEISHIEMQEFLSRYQSITKNIFETIKEFIKNSSYVKAKGWPDFQYSFISREFIKKHNLSNTDVSDASHQFSTEYIRTIQGYTWGMVFYPHTNGDVFISCRSLPNSVNVRDFVERALKGGGHDRASGATFKKKDKPLLVRSCIKKTLAWINSNSPTIN